MRQPIKPGVLEVYVGPMKSGKTREVINRVDKIEYLAAHNHVFFKPEIDTRSENIESRFGKLSVTCELIDEEQPEEILAAHRDASVVVIDEAQFFADSIRSVVKRLLADQCNVVVAGLDLDFRGEPFGAMPSLLSLADEVTKLTAICDYTGCEHPGTRTQRLIDGEPAPYDAPTIQVEERDTPESYEVRCKEHHVVPRASP